MTDAVKEKKGFYDSVYEAALSRDGASTEYLPSTIWQSIKMLFSGKFSFILKMSMLNLIFCLPIIAWSIVILLIQRPVAGTVGYSQNIIMSYGFLEDAIQTGNYLYYLNTMLYFSVLVACIVVAALGAGSLFCMARRVLWKQDIKLFRDFFGGIKTTWKTSLIGGTLSGGGLILMVMCLNIFDAYGLPVAGKVLAIIGSITLFALFCIYSVYLVSLNATYKMSLPEMLVSALKLTVGRMIPNIFMVIFCAMIGVLAWVLFTFVGSFAVFAAALLFAFGIYYFVAVCTVNTHRQFDRIINTGDDKSAFAVAYTKKDKNKEEDETPKHEYKKKPGHYTNPKKGKKKQNSSDNSKAEIAKLPENIKAGQDGLEEDLSVYLDTEDED